MCLSARIERDYIAAYKAKDALILSVLRLLKSAVKNMQVEKMRPLTDEEVFEVVMRQVKQRQDSITQYSEAHREDLAAKEQAELDILQQYMPPPLETEALAGVIDAAIAAIPGATMREMGKVMNSILAEYKGRVDGKVLSDMVREKLRLSS